MKKFFEELSRCLREGGVESSNVEDRRLEIFLHGQPVLFVSPGNDVFLFPAGSNNPEASELYHRVAQTADEVYTYVEEVQTAPTLHISGLSEKFHLLADFGGAVLAGRELENGRGYQFVTWIWDYNRTGVSYGHYKACADDRVKLQRIRKAVEQGEFDILLVFMYDQLGRNLNETPFIAEWFTKKGIHVWSVYEGEIIDAVDAERMLDYIRFWQTDEAQKL